MKKILSYVFIFLIATSGNLLAGGMLPAGGSTVVYGGDTETKWIGFPNTSGTPDSPQGSWAGYGYAGDRVYFLQRTASEDGTMEAINFRFSDTSNEPGTDCWFVAYNGTTLVGYAFAAAEYVDDDWTGYVTLTEVSTDSLDFDDGDTLRIGLGYDGTDNPGSAGGLAIDDGSSDSIYYDNSSTIDTAPPSTLSVSGPSGSYYGLGVILRYETR
jgi:hypothetical protein